MASFCVFQSPDGRPSRPVFIRDGFSAGAACLGAAWFVWRREWRAAASWVAALCVLIFGAAALGLGAGATVASVLVLCIFTGLEAAAIRARGLERRGYRLSTVIERPTLGDAETVHFARKLILESARVSTAAPRRTGEAEQVGLFIEGPK